MKKKKLRDSAEHERYIGAMWEDMNDKFKIVIEAVAPIPKMQEDIALLQQDVDGLKQNMDAVVAWKGNINLIPVMFEEIGAVRADLEVIKQEYKSKGKNDPRIAALEKRIARIEEKIAAR